MGVASPHQGPKACVPGQTPGSKIPLNSFHLISGAMLAFPPWHLPFGIWQSYLDPPPLGHTQGCHHSPKACLPGQTPGSKISLNSFHLISGAMLAFPPWKLTALYITSQNPDHTLTAHIWIWGSPCTPLIRCLDTTMHGKQKSRKTSFQRLCKKKQNQKTRHQKKNLRCTDGLTSSGGHTSPGSHGMSAWANPQIQNSP